MKNIELAKMIVFLVQEFFKDPNKFKKHYGLMKVYAPYHEQYLNGYNKGAYSINNSFYILCGTRFDNYQNDRWTCADDIDEGTNSSNIYTYAKNNKTTLVVEELISSFQREIDISNPNVFGEESIFQLSTVEIPLVVDTVEVMGYLFDNLDISFRMNLAMFDIEEAAKLYGYK